MRRATVAIRACAIYRGSTCAGQATSDVVMSESEPLIVSCNEFTAGSHHAETLVASALVPLVTAVRGRADARVLLTEPTWVGGDPVVATNRMRPFADDWEGIAAARDATFDVITWYQQHWVVSVALDGDRGDGDARWRFSARWFHEARGGWA